MPKKPVGWRNERRRHALAARGVKTANLSNDKVKRAPKGTTNVGGGGAHVKPALRAEIRQMRYMGDDYGSFEANRLADRTCLDLMSVPRERRTRDEQNFVSAYLLVKHQVRVNGKLVSEERAMDLLSHLE